VYLLSVLRKKENEWKTRKSCEGLVRVPTREVVVGLELDSGRTTVAELEIVLLLDVGLEAVLVESGCDSNAIGATGGLGVEVPSRGRITGAGGDVARVVRTSQDGTEILAGAEGVENTHSVHLAHDQLGDQVPCETRETEVKNEIEDSDASGERAGFQSQTNELGDDSLGLVEGGLDPKKGPDQGDGNTEIDDGGDNEPGCDEDGDGRHKTEVLDLCELDGGSDTASQGESNTSAANNKENFALGCPIASFQEERLCNCSNDSSYDDLTPETPILMIEVTEITKILYECSVRVFVVHSRL